MAAHPVAGPAPHSPDLRQARLARLITALQPQAPVPTDPADRWRVLRALMNVRPPGAVDPDVLAVQDALLQEDLAAKHVTHLEDLAPEPHGTYLWRGDITTLAVDAIVNAANSGLVGCFHPLHRCIDNAIHTFAGMQLREECAHLMRAQGHPEPTGTAKLTGGHNLPARHVLHTVGPMVPGALTAHHREQLASCYRSCLRLATQAGLRSVAFCCVSTGEFRFPRAEAARIAIDTVRDFTAHHPDAPDVVFTVFGDDDERIYRDLLAHPR